LPAAAAARGRVRGPRAGPPRVTVARAAPAADPRRQKSGSEGGARGARGLRAGFAGSTHIVRGLQRWLPFSMELLRAMRACACAASFVLAHYFHRCHLCMLLVA